MKLTIIIPVYNTKPHHLLESVYSILNQDDGTAHDIILWDDGSDDLLTLEALNHFHGLKNIRVIPAEHKGTPAAFNGAHRLVKTEYVALQGSDDISHGSRFRLQIDYLNKHPKTDVLGTNLFGYYDDDLMRTPIFKTNATELAAPMERNNKWWIVNHGTVIYRNDAVIAAGGYDEKFLRAQDINLWSRMVPLGFKFRNLTNCLYAWRRFK